MSAEKGLEAKKLCAEGYKMHGEERLREASGGWESSCVLTSILYDLLRDHIRPGDLQRIISVSTNPKVAGKPVSYTNGYLAKYAAFLAGEIARASKASEAE